MPKSMKNCGACGWSHKRPGKKKTRWLDCEAPIPDCAMDVERGVVEETEGRDCSCFKPRVDSLHQQVAEHNAEETAADSAEKAASRDLAENCSQQGGSKRMTMSTDGKQIEELSEPEQKREYRLRYAGAVKTLSLYELRVVAARLVATYPQFSRQQFVDQAKSAFDEVQGEVALSAREARNLEVAPASAAHDFDVDVLDLPPAQRVRILNVFDRANIRTVGDLVKQRPTDLLKLPNFGRKMLKSIEDELTKRGLTLAQ